jgi:hypothetical protein
VTLNDVEGQVQDRFRGRIRYANIWQTDLIAWRCRTCSAVVPAYDLTSPIMHLGGMILDEPKPDPLSENPFSDPSDRYEGNSEERLTSMTAEELREYCRYWDWERRSHTDPYNSWWCGKACSRGGRESSTGGDWTDTTGDPQRVRTGEKVAWRCSHHCWRVHITRE